VDTNAETKVGIDLHPRRPRAVAGSLIQPLNFESDGLVASLPVRGGDCSELVVAVVLPCPCYLVLLTCHRISRVADKVSDTDEVRVVDGDVFPGLRNKLGKQSSHPAAQLGLDSLRHFLLVNHAGDAVDDDNATGYVLEDVEINLQLFLRRQNLLF